tara:strand:+ start:3320 stop:3847 length:528 start_codon:yes stop_codon:yes gene_type:complete
MKLIFTLLLISNICFARHYVGLTTFDITVQPSSKDNSVENYRNSGMGYSLQYGYLLNSFAPEISYKVYRIDGNSNELSITNKYFNIGFRLFIGWFSFKLGIAVNNSVGETKGGAVDYESDNTTLSYGLGYKHRFDWLDHEWDLFGDLNIHSVEDKNIVDSNFILRELELGLRYWF